MGICASKKKTESSKTPKKSKEKVQKSSDRKKPSNEKQSPTPNAKDPKKAGNSEDDSDYMEFDRPMLRKTNSKTKFDVM